MNIAILTNFTEINHSYSLTGIALDQARMLTEYGHGATLFAQENFNHATCGPIDVRAAWPHTDLVDYQSERDISDEHREFIPRMADRLIVELQDYDVAFTHDWVFTGWNLPYALAIRLATERLPNLRWYHWVHSIPSGFRDWWNIRDYGPRHRLVYPNNTEAWKCARQYRGNLNDLVVLPHIKDLRTFGDFCEDTCRFINKYLACMQADIVQLLPCGQDRLKWKGVQDVIRMFAAMKKYRDDLSVCLIIANQHATGRSHPEEIQGYKNLAESLGLIPDEEFIFTSDFDDRFKGPGIPKRMVRELFQLTNLFVFPTNHESFGLVVPESALAGCYMVLNESLEMQREVAGWFGHFLPFGSHNAKVSNWTRNDTGESVTREKWLELEAERVVECMRRDRSIVSRTFNRQTYNWNNIYEQYYEPILLGERRHPVKRPLLAAENPKDCPTAVRI